MWVSYLVIELSEGKFYVYLAGQRLVVQTGDKAGGEKKAPISPAHEVTLLITALWT